MAGGTPDSASAGVTSEPAPTPVMPTSRPTTKPNAMKDGSMRAPMLEGALILSKTNVYHVMLFLLYEAPAAPLPHRDRAPGPERLRGGRGAAHLPARGFQADPGARGGARHRG